MGLQVDVAAEPLELFETLVRGLQRAAAAAAVAPAQNGAPSSSSDAPIAADALACEVCENDEADQKRVYLCGQCGQPKAGPGHFQG